MGFEIEKRDYIYQSFIFSNDLKDFFYAGDLYLGIENKKENEKLDVLFEICSNNKQSDFFPKLQKQICDLIGDGNYIYDYYEIGNNGFMLFWDICKLKYDEVIKKITSWVKYENIEPYVFFYIKNEKGDIVSSFGNEEVKKNYYNNLI